MTGKETAKERERRSAADRLRRKRRLGKETANERESILDKTRKLRRNRRHHLRKKARLAAYRLRRQQQSEEQQETRLAQLRSNQAECLGAVILTKTRHISYAYQYQKCCTLAALIWLQGPTFLSV